MKINSDQFTVSSFLDQQQIKSDLIVAALISSLVKIVSFFMRFKMRENKKSMHRTVINSHGDKIVWEWKLWKYFLNKKLSRIWTTGNMNAAHMREIASN